MKCPNCNKKFNILSTNEMNEKIELLIKVQTQKYLKYKTLDNFDEALFVRDIYKMMTESFTETFLTNK